MKKILSVFNIPFIVVSIILIVVLFVATQRPKENNVQSNNTEVEKIIYSPKVYKQKDKSEYRKAWDDAIKEAKSRSKAFSGVDNLNSSSFIKDNTTILDDKRYATLQTKQATEYKKVITSITSRKGLYIANATEKEMLKDLLITSSLYIPENVDLIPYHVYSHMSFMAAYTAFTEYEDMGVKHQCMDLAIQYLSLTIVEAAVHDELCLQ